MIHVEVDCSVVMSRIFGRVHTFLNAQFKIRKFTFLRLYPANFHKTKCIAYANMSTFI